MSLFEATKKRSNDLKKLFHALIQGSQTQIAPWATWGLTTNPRAALWRWRNNSGIRT